MILGAILGGTLIAYLLMLSVPLSSRRMMVANFVLHRGGAVLVTFLISATPDLLERLGTTPAHKSINSHIAFNLAVIALPFVGLRTSLSTPLMSDQIAQDNLLLAASALDPNALAQPQRGLNCAAYELLRMGEKIEYMLISVEPLYDTCNLALAKTISGQDATIKKMHLDVKFYLTSLGRADLGEKFGHCSMELASISSSLIPHLIPSLGSCWNLPSGLTHKSFSFHDKVAKKLAIFPIACKATCNRP